MEGEVRERGRSLTIGRWQVQFISIIINFLIQSVTDLPLKALPGGPSCPFYMSPWFWEPSLLSIWIQCFRFILKFPYPGSDTSPMLPRSHCFFKWRILFRNQYLGTSFAHWQWDLRYYTLSSDKAKILCTSKIFYYRLVKLSFYWEKENHNSY